MLKDLNLEAFMSASDRAGKSTETGTNDKHMQRCAF